MKLKTIPLVAFTAITLAGSASAVTVIYFDDFNDQQNINNGGPYTQTLAGSAPTTRNAVFGGSSSATWTGLAETGGWGQRDYADSNVATPTSSNYLSFTPQSGYTYTVTATIDCSNLTNGEWFTVGFSQNAKNWAALTGKYVDTSEANLVRGNATPANREVATVSITVSGDTLIANSIAYVGWVTTIEGVANLTPTNQQVKIDNFSLTAVPEPSAALLGGLGMLALLRRRR